MSATLKSCYAPAPMTARAKPTVIGVHPKGTHIVYACGNGIVIKNLSNPLDTDIYYGHTCQTTCAKYSPSGYYICSGDVQGNVRIWDTTQKEHPLKIQLKMLSSSINDIAWTADSQRIAVVGEGKEKLGAVFMWDAGSSVGEISGHTKTLMSVDLKPTRPFRLITGGEDNYVNWFEGPPFKFKKSNKDFHTRFCNCVRFSPDGSYAVSCGSDKKVVLIDGKTGDKIWTKENHKAGVYSLAWSPDNKHFVTASADKTCKLWNVEGEVEKVFEFGNKTEMQQLGLFWAKDPVSISLDATLSVLNVDDVKTPKEIIYGHNKNITSMYKSADKLYTASFDGRVIEWEESGKNIVISGPTHQSTINQMQVFGEYLITCGMDDTIKYVDLAKHEFVESIAVESPARAFVISGDVIIVGTHKGIKIIKDKKVVNSIATDAVACMTIHPDGKTFAVGLKDKPEVHIYEIDGTNITLKEKLTSDVFRDAINAISYSPNGEYLATADVSRYVLLWKVNPYEIIYDRWVPHASKVTSLAWNPSSTAIVSGGVDSNAYVYNVATKAIIPINRCNPQGVQDVKFGDDNTVYTCGQDCAVRVYTITL